MDLGDIDTTYKTLAAVAGIAGVLFAFWKKVRPWLKGIVRDFRAGRDALVGREAIVDTITGRQLVPALPGMGVRMDTTETQLRELNSALTSVAGAVSKMADSTLRVDDLENRVKHLEEAAVERVITRAESTAAWQAVEAVAKSSPPVEPEADDHPKLPGLGEN